MDQALRRLPEEALPEGAPESKLTEAQHVEIYGLGSMRAVIVVEAKNDKHVIKTSWLSSQDANLARQLMDAVRKQYLIPQKGLLFHVVASQPALMDEVKGSPLRAQLMSKQVEPSVELPEGISYRDMTATEARDYLLGVEEEFVNAMLMSKSENEDEKDVRERSRAVVTSISPNGYETPGQRFIVVNESGTAVSTLWVGERSAKQSFCYNVEVQVQKRGVGYGRKTLVVWEHVAASCGLVTLGLSVFGSNTVALKLYAGGGFQVDDATFILDNRQNGI